MKIESICLLNRLEVCVRMGDIDQQTRTVSTGKKKNRCMKWCLMGQIGRTGIERSFGWRDHSRDKILMRTISDGKVLIEHFHLLR